MRILHAFFSYTFFYNFSFFFTEIKLFKIRPTEQEDHPARPFCRRLESSEAVQSGKGGVTKTLICWDVTVRHCVTARP
jgi:hypothetical protein